jgi:hypothetical protein
MLRVSGKEMGRSGRGGKEGGGDVEDLVKRFERGLEGLNEVLGEDDGRGGEEGDNVVGSQRAGSGED